MIIKRIAGVWIGLLRQNVGTDKRCYFNSSSIEGLFRMLEANI